MRVAALLSRAARPSLRPVVPFGGGAPARRLLGALRDEEGAAATIAWEGGEGELGPPSPFGEGSGGTDEIATFYDITGGGYNGRLEAAHKGYTRWERVSTIIQAQQAAGSRPQTVVMYNYWIGAALHDGKMEEALGLICEMEGKALRPDVVTFELLLYHLSRNRRMTIIVDELFDMMRTSFGLAPSRLCWSARLRAWAVYESSHERFVQIIEEMRAAGGRVAHDSDMYATALLIAVGNAQWSAVDYMLTSVIQVPDGLVPRRLGGDDGGGRGATVKLSTSQFQSIWHYVAGRLCSDSLDLVRLLVTVLHPIMLDEGSYACLLAYARRTPHAETIARAALAKIAHLYGWRGKHASTTRRRLPAEGGCEGGGDGGREGAAARLVTDVVPKHYLDWYGDCIRLSRATRHGGGDLEGAPPVEAK